MAEWKALHRRRGTLPQERAGADGEERTYTITSVQRGARVYSKKNRPWQLGDAYKFTPPERRPACGKVLLPDRLRKPSLCHRVKVPRSPSHVVCHAQI